MRLVLAFKDYEWLVFICISRREESEREREENRRTCGLDGNYNLAVSCYEWSQSRR